MRDAAGDMFDNILFEHNLERETCHADDVHALAVKVDFMLCAAVDGYSGGVIDFHLFSVAVGSDVHDEAIVIVSRPVKQFFKLVKLAHTFDRLLLEPVPLFAQADGVFKGKIIRAAAVVGLMT